MKSKNLKKLSIEKFTITKLEGMEKIKGGIRLNDGGTQTDTDRPDSEGLCDILGK